MGSMQDIITANLGNLLNIGGFADTSMETILGSIGGLSYDGDAPETT